MKKLLLALICILPAMCFAQVVFKQINMPRLAIDSTTKLRTLCIVQTASGVNKDKLAGVLSKWMGSNYTLLNTGKTAGDTSATIINSTGIFVGSCPIKHLESYPNETDKVSTNQQPIDYKIDFNVKLVVASGSYTVTVDNLKLEYLNVIEPIEMFYDVRGFPNVWIPGEDRGMDVGEMYNHMFNDIDLHLKDIAKSAAKYITKAQKKGQL
jgi:hypothetical protein